MTKTISQKIRNVAVMIANKRISREDVNDIFNDITPRQRQLLIAKIKQERKQHFLLRGSKAELYRHRTDRVNEIKWL